MAIDAYKENKQPFFHRMNKIYVVCDMKKTFERDERHCRTT